jgi:hypothetical protein
VAKLLAARSPRAVHLESDWFFRFIRSGYLEPWEAEAHEQNTAVMRAVAGAAAAYAEAGYFSIIDGIVSPGWFLVPLRGWLHAAGHTVAYAILRPPLDDCVSRALSREPGPRADRPIIERLWHDFAELGPWEGHVIANGTASPEETAETLNERLRIGALNA